MAIASKEARETHYWLRLTRDSPILPPSELHSPIAEIESIKRLLSAIVKSASE